MGTYPLSTTTNSTTEGRMFLDLVIWSIASLFGWTLGPSWHESCLCLYPWDVCWIIKKYVYRWTGVQEEFDLPVTKPFSTNILWFHGYLQSTYWMSVLLTVVCDYHGSSETVWHQMIGLPVTSTHSSSSWTVFTLLCGLPENQRYK